jgi:hypothetical protein
VVVSADGTRVYAAKEFDNSVAGGEFFAPQTQ